MALSQSDSLRLYGTEAYTAWGEAEAAADAAAHPEKLGNVGGGGGGGGFSADAYIQAIADLLPKPKDPYTQVNPFSFDEENARQLADAEFSPYYEELLSDYLTEAQKTQERIGEDQTAFLAELNSQRDYFVQNEQTTLQRLLRGTREGYSAKNLYFSGERQRTEMEQQSDSEKSLADYMRRSDYEKSQYNTNVDRQTADITTQKDMYQRDIGREKTTAIEGNIQTQRGEALDEYLIGMQEYYNTPNYSDYL